LSLLLRIIWLLLRVVILLLTGEWVRGKPGDPANQLPVSGVPAANARTLVLSDDDRKKLAGWVEQMMARALSLRAQARDVIGGRTLLAALDKVINPQLELARKALAQPAHVGWTERVTALDAALSALLASAEARRDREVARRLCDVEAMAVDAFAPLYVHLRAKNVSMAERVLFALPTLDAQSERRIVGQLLLLPLPGAESAIVPAMRRVAERVVEEVPGWVSGALSSRGLPRALPLPSVQVGYDVASARSAVGVWYATLAVDVLATLALGPGFASTLAAELTRGQNAQAAVSARSQGRFLSATPPVALRILALTRALSALGLHAAAERLWSAYTAQLGEPSVLLLPFVEASAVQVPLSFLQAELDPLLDSLCRESQSALADEALIDVPGFAYLHAEDTQAKAAAARFLNAESSTASARICAAAALLALSERPDRAAQIGLALGRSVRGQGTLEAVTNVAPKTEQPALTLRKMLNNPRELCTAFALGTALQRRPRSPHRG
jgi:hypothetical protein